MHWNSIGEFFAMGGYALYVWGSFAACAIAMLVEPLLIRQRRQELLRMLRSQRDIEDADAQLAMRPRP